MYRVVSAAARAAAWRIRSGNCRPMPPTSKSCRRARPKACSTSCCRSSSSRRATGSTINYGPAGNIANRVRKGEAVDVLISSEPEAGAVAQGRQDRRRQPDRRGQGRHRHLRSQGRSEARHQHRRCVPAHARDRQGDRLCGSEARRLGEHPGRRNCCARSTSPARSARAPGWCRRRSRWSIWSRAAASTSASSRSRRFSSIRASNMSGRSRRRTSTTPITWRAWSRPASRPRPTRRC